MISNIMGQYLILDIALYKRYRGRDNMIHFLKFFKADNSDDSPVELVDNTILEDEEKKVKVLGTNNAALITSMGKHYADDYANWLDLLDKKKHMTKLTHRNHC